jgi:hypothetical protein
MDRPKKPRSPHGPEFSIQRDIVRFLTNRGWRVERLVGMAWQSGLPDLLAGHKDFGMRFIEVKYEDKYHFTQAQKCKFPLLMDHGMGIWILTEASKEQYDRLFTTPNLWDYLKRSDCPSEDDIDRLMQEIEEENDNAGT